MRHELASYGTVCTWAELPALDKAKEPLGQTLNEEENTDKKLSTLSKTINKKAV